MKQIFRWLKNTFFKGKKLKTKPAIFFGLFLIALVFFSWRDSYFQNTSYTTVLLDKDNNLLSAKIADDGQWRFPPSDSIPANYATCIALFEDEYFNYHFGVNPFSTARALWQNFKAKKTVSGGSTLTMQVIRLATSPKSRSLFQKIKEMVLATRLEFQLSKKEILRLHAAHAPFGGNVVGIEAASWRYYNRSPFNLSWAEYALLAVLPNAPSLLRPGKNEALLIAKRNRLLDKLFEKGYIDKTQLKLSKLETIPTSPKALPQQAYHLLQSQAEKQKGTRIESTIDANLQMRSEQLLDRFINEYVGNNINNGAILVVEIESGNVLAYVGNASFNSKSNKGLWNDMVLTPRSTGSVLKPFLYASMLNEGDILPNSLVEDVPTFFSGYVPKNYSQDYNGAVPASQALARSLNVPAVRMLRDYSYPKFHSKLKKLGMKTLYKAPSHYGLSIVLGGAEGTLLDLCGMYASLGRTLIHFEEHSLFYRSNDIRRLNISQNSDFSEYTLKNKSELNAGAIWHMIKAMEEVNRPENQRGWERFSSSKRVAWKTGTSFGYRDAWAIGMDGKYVVGVWVGNADGEGRDELVGVKKAAPILFETFNLLPNAEWFTTPFDDLKKAVICKTSGFVANELCNKTDTQFIPDVALRMSPCPFHKMAHLNQEETFQVNASCYPFEKIKNESWFVLPTVQEYYYAKINTWYKKLPPQLPGCNNQSNASPLSFIYPEDFSKVKIPTELDGQKGELVLKLAHRNQEQRVFWYIDNEFIAETKSYHEVGINLATGKHQITVVDDMGESLTRTLTIVD